MNAVFKWTLHMKRSYTIWWTIGIATFVAVELAFYPSFKGQFDELNKTLANMPAGVKGLIGDSGSYFSPETYLNSRVFYLVVPMLLVILMINISSKLIALEERSGTLELLLSRPISRSRLVLGKALSGLAITAIATFFSLVVCIGLSKAVDIPNSVAEISAAMLLTYLLCLIFGSFTFMLTALGGRFRNMAVGLTILFFVSSYVLTGLEGVADWLKPISKLMPYHYFKPQQMLLGNYNWKTVGVFAMVSLGFGIIAIVGFRRRDIG